MNDIKIPQLSLILLIGPSGSGKSTFAAKHFKNTEIISSDFCRGLVSDDENDQSATPEAFELLRFIAAKRLARGKLTVIDATNVQPEARKPLIQLARQYHCFPVAIVLNVPESVCKERNRDRVDRNFGSRVIHQQYSQLRRSIKGLKREGFRHIFIMNNVEEMNSATIERVPLWTDRRSEHGPFDIIGDVHGCCDELEGLLTQLGYELDDEQVYRHPERRKAIFVGDLVDRGPRILDVVTLVRKMVEHETALCVPGNHDIKIVHKLRGKDVQINHGLAETLQEIEQLNEDIRSDYCQEMVTFLDGLVSHYVLDEGKLVVAHAGMKEEMQGRASGKVREFALYGEKTGETDEFGLPIRYKWASDYRGSALVVYGHTPVPEPEWLNRTINVDTGCVFGGRLTALRYPENELVSVPAKRVYYEPARLFLNQDAAANLTAQQADDDLLDAEDVMGKRIISTRFRRNVTIREENATAALEVMSRFAVNPKWLIYLPPTMSPSETSAQPGVLEHPAEAFRYFRTQGVAQVVCEEKHMGSRAVMVICRDQESARERFGIVEDEIGIVYTRTGRRFFDDLEIESQFLHRVQTALTKTDFWEQFNTTWACFDCELLPWSAKAQELLRSQYAAVGVAGRASLPRAVSLLEQTAQRSESDVQQLIEQVQSRYQTRLDNIRQFVTAYRQYCWPVESLDDLKLAPFHLLATERKIHIDQNHQWHMETLAKLCEADPQLLLTTRFKVIDVTISEEEEGGIEWWQSLTEQGGEGMVVKPLLFVVKGKKGLVQPAIKCRGPEYLRIIYGADYRDEENLTRLRSRNLSRKRSLAIREFALGIEGLERFIQREPLRRTHECVFGVLALESEPIDPRL